MPDGMRTLAFASQATGSINVVNRTLGNRYQITENCSNSGEKRSRVLKVYNWADYIDEEVLTEFPAWYKEQTKS